MPQLAVVSAVPQRRVAISGRELHGCGDAGLGVVGLRQAWTAVLPRLMCALILPPSAGEGNRR
jgi:hypothetical protein